MTKQCAIIAVKGFVSSSPILTVKLDGTYKCIVNNGVQATESCNILSCLPVKCLAILFSRNVLKLDE